MLQPADLDKHGETACPQRAHECMHAALELRGLAGSLKCTVLLAHFSQRLQVYATEFNHQAAALRPAMGLRMPAGLTRGQPLAMLLLQAHSGAGLVASRICTAYTAAAPWLAKSFSTAAAAHSSSIAVRIPLQEPWPPSA